MKRSDAKTSSRKKEHVDLVVQKDIRFRRKLSGFEHWEFEHNALPEIDLSEISTETLFLSKRLRIPFIISGMTGGYPDAKNINRALAQVCEEFQIALGIGSQRQALENRNYHSSFAVARKYAPTIPIVGNIGASEIAWMTDVDPIRRLVELIAADGFAIHLNPLQELLQPEGTVNFRGVLAGIEKLAHDLPVPLIVKEVGSGISKSVARRLLDAGVSIIDIAGAGGTSWAGVEILRGKKKLHGEFWDWGIPTAESLVKVASLRSSHSELTIIASGGIDNGLDAAKAFALGADIAGAARVFIQQYFAGGTKGVANLVSQWKSSFTAAMFLTGSATLAQLRRAPMLHDNRER